MTIPGYLIQGVMFAMLYGAVAAAVPSTTGRRIALPAALVVAALVRWNWPFGGVPLASLAISQSDAPLAQTARVFGSLTIVALVGVGGVVLSAAVQRNWRDTAVGFGVLVLATLTTVVAPHGQAIDTIDIAIVQGGGPQQYASCQHQRTGGIRTTPRNKSRRAGSGGLRVVARERGPHPGCYRRNRRVRRNCRTRAGSRRADHRWHHRRPSAARVSS